MRGNHNLESQCFFKFLLKIRIMGLNEQNRESRDRPTYLCSIDFQQRYKVNLVEKR